MWKNYAKHVKDFKKKKEAEFRVNLSEVFSRSGFAFPGVQ